MVSPTQRSLKLLRDEGWHVEIVEHWNPWSKTRKDLWNFADLLACKRFEPPLAIQVTSYSHHAARRNKILNNPIAKLILSTGIRIEIHSWRKVKNRWTPRIEEITLELCGKI